MYVLTSNGSFFVEIHLSGKYGKLCKCPAIIPKFGKPAIIGNDVLNTKCTRSAHYLLLLLYKKSNRSVLEASVFAEVKQRRDPILRWIEM